jgi:hypothetical protein
MNDDARNHEREDHKSVTVTRVAMSNSFVIIDNPHYTTSGRGSSVGIVTELRVGRSADRIPVEARFSARPDRSWSPNSLLYNAYRVFPRGKVWPRCAAEHSPPSSTEVLVELSYISIPLWVTTGPVTGLL